jgi:hypothetical protein
MHNKKDSLTSTHSYQMCVSISKSEKRCIYHIYAFSVPCLSCSLFSWPNEPVCGSCLKRLKKNANQTMSQNISWIILVKFFILKFVFYFLFRMTLKKLIFDTQIIEYVTCKDWKGFFYFKFYMMMMIWS